MGSGIAEMGSGITHGFAAPEWLTATSEKFTAKPSTLNLISEAQR